MTRDLQDKKLKAVERAVLRSGKISDAEIEQILGAPQFFERIRENIKTEESRRETKVKNVFALPTFQFWSGQKSVLAFTALAILIVCAVTIFMRFPAPPEMAQKDVAEEKRFPVELVKKQPEIVSTPITATPKDDFQARQITPEKKAKLKNNPPAQQKSPRMRRRLPHNLKNQTEEPFIALTYAGDLANEESQIVRVELTPARLLALGVAVQTENEGEKIKTDLLVGSDGLARAIRLVK